MVRRSTASSKLRGRRLAIILRKGAERPVDVRLAPTEAERRRDAYAYYNNDSCVWFYHHNSCKKQQPPLGTVTVVYA